VDYVSRAIVALMKDQNPGANYHLSNPSPLPLGNLVTWMDRHGFPTKVVPLEHWLEHHCRTMPSANALYPLLPFLTERTGPDRLTFLEIFCSGKVPAILDENARAALGQAECLCPPVDDRLLSTYFSYFERTGFLPSRGGAE
jgi:hypothetical protein